MVKEIIHIRGAGTPVDPKIEVYMSKEWFNKASPERREANYLLAKQAAWEHGYTHIRVRAFNHSKSYALDIQGKRIAWDDKWDWVLLDADPHITAVFWNQHLPGEFYNAHVYVEEENDVPTRLMDVTERKFSRWNDNGAPQLWHVIREERFLEEDVEYMDTCALEPASQLPAWMLALAAHSADLDESDTETYDADIAVTKISRFLAEQKTLKSDEDYEPQFDDPIQEFLWFVKEQQNGPTS